MEDEKDYSRFAVILDGAKTRYFPGETIDTSGIAVTFDGKDVTDRCSFVIENNLRIFPMDMRDVFVSVRYGDYLTRIPLFRKTPILPYIEGFVFGFLIAGFLGYFVW